jgi:hypothetical protein
MRGFLLEKNMTTPWYQMSFAPEQIVLPTGVPYSGAILQAYAAGTNTPISMATDTTGATTAAYFALNAAGYPVSGGNVIIPCVSQNYKLILWPNAAAQASQTGAVWTVDNIDIVPPAVVIPSVVPTLGYNNQSSTYAPVAADQASLLDFKGASGIATWTLTAAGTLGANWWCIIKNPTIYNLTLKSSGGTIDGIAAATGIVLTPGSAVIVQCDGSAFHTADAPRAYYQATPANPSGISSASAEMLGLAGAITPTRSGTILVMISGDATVINGATGKLQLAYGTGSAPANAAAATGTVAGGLVVLKNTGSSSANFPWALHAIVAGLTVGTAYWLDVQATAVASNTITPENISISVVEI